MNFIKNSAFAIIVFSISACSKQTGKAAAGNASENKGLVDSWEWVRTDGGLAYHIHDTPLSTGKHIVLKMAGDSTYSIYTNNELTLQGTYTLETRTCIHDHTQKSFILFSSGQGMMIEKLERESLQLSDESHDGLGSQYKRAVTNAR